MWKIAAGLLALVGSVLPSMCRAQDTNTKQVPAPYRFYVGGQWAYHQYIFNYSTFPNVTDVSPWYVNAGYYISPRLAVQAGIMYMHDTFTGGGAGVNSAGKPIADIRTDNTWNTLVPMLLRFTLIRTSDRRFSMDALAGGTYGFSHGRLEQTETVAGQVIRYNLIEVRQPGFFLTVGLAGRFIFNRRWEIVGDWTYSRNTANISKQSYWQAGVPNGRTRGLSLGVRYRFNLKRKAAESATL
ncbi:outer membrane beta-barrel protein [Hymenobacter nivis]|uniref:Uncharacterized protein n=1 Tax=Hymenobacter nivis TaxID=1850093 RepID=A0A2Z3GIY1_9BACT|nr:outer membrane beta-barrel protein [Hymenobacter nivis]AWM33098.1 hypothetical protein DDQ68_10110 [Hymenobacter nivis]